LIAAPGGTEAARAGSKPEVIFADLDAEQVRAAQARLPYFKDRLSLKLT
jgi:predicted amidohydrolase